VGAGMETGGAAGARMGGAATIGAATQAEPVGTGVETGGAAGARVETGEAAGALMGGAARIGAETQAEPVGAGVETGEAAGARVETVEAAGARVEAGGAAGARVEAGGAAGARVEAGGAAGARVGGAVRIGAATRAEPVGARVEAGGAAGAAATRVAVARASASRSSFFSAGRQSPCVAVGSSSARKAAHSALAPTRIASVDGPMPHRNACFSFRSCLKLPAAPMCMLSRYSVHGVPLRIFGDAVAYSRANPAHSAVLTAGATLPHAVIG